MVKVCTEFVKKMHYPNQTEQIRNMSKLHLKCNLLMQVLAMIASTKKENVYAKGNFPRGKCNDQSKIHWKLHFKVTRRGWSMHSCKKTLIIKECIEHILQRIKHLFVRFVLFAFSSYEHFNACCFLCLCIWVSKIEMKHKILLFTFWCSYEWIPLDGITFSFCNTRTTCETSYIHTQIHVQASFFFSFPFFIPRMLLCYTQIERKQKTFFHFLHLFVL